MKTPDKKIWSQEWTPRQAADILRIATDMRSRGAPNDISAWKNAENKMRTDLRGPVGRFQ